jgi:hypothetical protein
MAEATFAGVYQGTSGSIQFCGLATVCHFSAAGGAPTVGAQVYLGSSSVDGSEGIFTVTKPSATGAWVSPVGVVAGAIVGTGPWTADILLQPEAPVENTGAPDPNTINGLNTSAVSTSGLAVYFSSSLTVETTDSSAGEPVTLSTFVGVYQGVAGEVQFSGLATACHFSNAGGVPTVGAIAYLGGLSTDGSEGIFTVLKPSASTSWNAPVGIVAGAITGTGPWTADMLIQVKNVTEN